jgi:hypothetical protein
MRKEYTPSTPLNHTYLGPYRIMQLFHQGALLKDPKTGEQMSVHFINLRKLTMDEFITLLPTHFDSEILKSIGLFRYNKKGNPETVKSADETEIINQSEESDKEINERHDPAHQQDTTSDVNKFSEQTKRILRSGKRINISVNTLPYKYKPAVKAQWTTLPIPKQPYINKERSTIKRIATLKTPNTPYYIEEQFANNVTFSYSTSIENRMEKIKPEKNFKTRYKSSFQSDRTGILYITLPQEENSTKKVRFSRIEVKFY